jgi:protein transport protein YIF1
MQRPTYSVPPANSPPLHHPIPQHVSTVPQLRSPPIPTSQNGQQQQGGYGYQSPPQGQAGASSYMHPAFGGFINDPTTQMGIQMGKTAFDAGSQIVEQNVSTTCDKHQALELILIFDQINRYVNVSALKHYFNVSNGYVLQKLYIVLFPWRHRPWSRQQSRMSANGQAAEFLPPREDVNSPGKHNTLPIAIPANGIW